MLNLQMIGQKIAQLRIQHNMNQEALADALYVTRQAVSKWEMGKSIPSIELLISLTQLFNISIDYLLDHSDISEDDYQSMLMIYPRSSVIHKFVNSVNPEKEIDKIFYLLSQNERKQVIDQVLSYQINMDIIALWPYASINERKYILKSMISKEDQDMMRDIYPMLNDEERGMVAGRVDHYVFYRNKKSKKKERKS